MISDLDAAQLQLAAYESAGLTFTWDWYTDAGGVRGGIKRFGDTECVILPGSETKQDWFRDFRALPDTTAYPAFGKVHYGFFEGMVEFAAQLRPVLSTGLPIVIMGHSLGAGRAPLLAALLREAGVNVARLICFAPPRPGFAELATYLADVPKVLYRTVGDDGHDYVTDVPLTIPGIAPFVEVGPFTDLPVVPASTDTWGLFRYHHMELYLAGLTSAAPEAK